MLSVWGKNCVFRNIFYKFFSIAFQTWNWVKQQILVIYKVWCGWYCHKMLNWYHFGVESAFSEMYFTNFSKCHFRLEIGQSNRFKSLTSSNVVDITIKCYVWYHFEVKIVFSEIYFTNFSKLHFILESWVKQQILVIYKVWCGWYCHEMLN